MKIQLKILFVLFPFFINSCNSQQDNSTVEKLNKGDLILISSEFDDCSYNFLTEEELVLFNYDVGKLSELNIKHPKYNIDFPSISPSGKMMFLKKGNNAHLFLYDLIQKSFAEIPYSKIRTLNDVRFGPTFEFYSDSIIIVSSSSELYEYHINSNSFVKIASFDNSIVDKIFVPSNNHSNILIKLRDLIEDESDRDDDLLMQTNALADQYGFYTLNNNTLKKTLTLDVPDIQDVSPSGNLVIVWDDSLYTYNISTGKTKTIPLLEKLNSKDFRKLMFFDENTIVLTDIISYDNKCFSYLIYYNTNSNEVIKKINLGEKFYRIAEVKQ